MPRPPAPHNKDTTTIIRVITENPGITQRDLILEVEQALGYERGSIDRPNFTNRRLRRFEEEGLIKKRKSNSTERMERLYSVYYPDFDGMITYIWREFIYKEIKFIHPAVSFYQKPSKEQVENLNKALEMFLKHRFHLNLSIHELLEGFALTFGRLAGVGIDALSFKQDLSKVRDAMKKFPPSFITECYQYFCSKSDPLNIFSHGPNRELLFGS